MSSNFKAVFLAFPFEKSTFFVFQQKKYRFLRETFIDVKSAKKKLDFFYVFPIYKQIKHLAPQPINYRSRKSYRIYIFKKKLYIVIIMTLSSSTQVEKERKSE